MRLEGKTALITGGGTGIGFEVAKAYVEQGAYVYITGRRENVLKEACDKMAGLGRFSGIVMSTASSDPLQILMDYIKIFTHIDIIRFYGMRKQIMDHSKDIDLMLTIIGFLDFFYL